MGRDRAPTPLDHCRLGGMLAGMFTGIIEHVGTVVEVGRRDSGLRLTIDLGPLAEGTRVGESIAVSGVCLTVETRAGSHAAFDLSAETCRVTTLGSAVVGLSMNLERALAFGSRLGGHLVSGHVDGLGTVAERTRETVGERFVIALPSDGAVRVIEKGSLAVDGISLTTFACRDGRCAIAVIPHTLTHTTLATAQVGSVVNLEQDLISRWVAELAQPYFRAPPPSMLPLNRR